MLNDSMLKPTYQICLKCKYQLKQKTVTREKMLQLIKSAFFEKWILSFKILNSDVNSFELRGH